MEGVSELPSSVGHEPSGYKSHRVAPAGTAAGPGERAFPLEDGSVMIASPLQGPPPDRIDILSTYRPAEGQLEILEDALKRGARAFWVEPGESVSDAARERAKAAGIAFIEDVSIADTVTALGVRAALR